jgi:hypothetical protein
MFKLNRITYFTFGLWLVATTGCLGAGLYRPEATEAALQATVSALQGTIIALEQTTSAQVHLEESASSQPIVATATASPTRPAATSTLMPARLRPTASATQRPTATKRSGASQGETVALTASPTTTPIPTASPTPPPTPTPLDLSAPPLLLEPGDGTIIEQSRNILLRWSWSGRLEPNQYFDIKIRPDGQTASAYVAWAADERFDWQADLPPGRYYWSVQVIQGYYQNDSGRPEDRVFEKFLGPESETRLMVIHERPPATPRSVSQADPPGPGLPYGLLIGSLAFIAFAGWSRSQPISSA